MFNFVNKFKDWFDKLTDKKKHLEFITAILSVPVLLSVIFLNYSSIRNQNKNIDTNQITPPIITIIQEKAEEDKPSPTPNAQCQPEVGPVSISSPEDGETVTANPLTIAVEQNDVEDEFCAIVWSYRINNGSWSNFDDRDISVYNVDSGEKKLEVRVKSIISGKEKTLQRSFTYRNTEAIPTPTATGIPTQTPTAATTPPDSLHQ